MINKLKQLSERHPDMCRFTTTPNGDYYAIGEYEFWESRGDLLATRDGDYSVITGQPALDWLAGALKAECVKWKMYFAIKYWPEDNRYWARVEGGGKVWADTEAETMLDALLEG